MGNDIIIAVATPIGESAIGVIRLSGPGVFSILDLFFGGKIKASIEKKQYRLVSAMVEPVRREVIDQVVVSLFVNPRSFTGEDSAEIACHGSPLILKETLNALIREGARLAQPGEFTQRAFLNGKLDLTRAEAVNDLIHAHTRYAKSAALSQLQGKFAQAIETIHVHTLDLLAQLEAAIDHSDLEEVFISPEKVQSAIDGLIEEIIMLLRTAETGKMARNGIRLAIVGAPNSGKSSLMNFMLAEDRVIVSEVAGTTRDVVEDELNVRGIPVRLLDTAGIRESQGKIEQKGIERTLQQIRQADLRLVLFDGSKPLSDEDNGVIQAVEGLPSIFILNKSDLPRLFEMETLEKLTGQAPIVISTLEGKGLKEIEDKIEAFFFSFGVNPEKDILVTNVRQEGLLRSACDELVKAAEALKSGLSEEFVASGVRKCRLHIEEITGRTTDDAILDRIFSQFCIGK